MLRTSFILIVIAMLVGCTSAPISPTEQTNPTIITEPSAIEVSTPLPLKSTVETSPTTEPNIGKLLWIFKPGSADEPPFWVSPLTSATAFNGIIYVGASDVVGGKLGSLHALNAGDGSLLWSYGHNGHTPSTPTVADGVVYFGSEDHNIYAVDAHDGEGLWAYTTGGQVRSKPYVYETMVFMNSQDGHLYALNTKDGRLQWRYQFDEPVSDIASLGSLPSSPTADNGAAFIVGSDHTFRAINISDGTLRWEYDIGGQVFGSPQAANGIVYVGSLNRSLYAFNSTDGSILWSHQADGAIISTPVVEDGRVFVSSNVISAIDAISGTVLWQYDPDILGSLGSPIIEGSKLYVASFDGHLFVLDRDHGNLLTVYAMEENIGQKAPAVVDGVMYIVAKDRSLYAVRMID